MKPWVVAAGIAAILLFACNGDVRNKPITGKPKAGGLYSFNDGEGGFRVGKVVAVSDFVFVRLFKERWMKRPSLDEAQQSSQPLPVAYSFESMEAMQPVLLQMEKVTPEELAVYEQWGQSAQDVY